VDEKDMIFTREQAIAFDESKAWESMTFRQRAEFQMVTELLCMPFDVFHEALQKTLGRPVFTHELADWDSITAELFGEKGSPSMEEISKMILEEKG